MEVNIEKHKGFGFGTPREKMHNTLRNNLHSDNQVGPANYNDREKYLNDSRYKSSGNRIVGGGQQERFRSIQANPDGSLT